jgi:hypothetical protein
MRCSRGASENKALAIFRLRIADCRWRSCLIMTTQNVALSLHLEAIQLYLLYIAVPIAFSIEYTYLAIDTFVGISFLRGFKNLFRLF